MSDTSYTKKRRILYSCAPCRKRKVKCNRGQPCLSCVKHGIASQCIYELSDQGIVTTQQKAEKVTPIAQYNNGNDSSDTMSTNTRIEERLGGLRDKDVTDRLMSVHEMNPETAAYVVLQTFRDKAKEIESYLKNRGGTSPLVGISPYSGVTPLQKEVSKLSPISDDSYVIEMRDELESEFWQRNYNEVKYIKPNIYTRTKNSLNIFTDVTNDAAAPPQTPYAAISWWRIHYKDPCLYAIVCFFQQQSNENLMEKLSGKKLIRSNQEYEHEKEPKDDEQNANPNDLLAKKDEGETRSRQTTSISGEEGVLFFNRLTKSLEFNLSILFKLLSPMFADDDSLIKTSAFMKTHYDWFPFVDLEAIKIILHQLASFKTESYFKEIMETGNVIYDLCILILIVGIKDVEELVLSTNSRSSDPGSADFERFLMTSNLIDIVNCYSAQLHIKVAEGSKILQLLFLLNFYYNIHPDHCDLTKTERVLLPTSNLIQIGYGMGLNILETAESLRKDTSAQNTRLWYHLLILDFRNCCLHGYPPNIKINYYDDYSSNINHNQELIPSEHSMESLRDYFVQVESMYMRMSKILSILLNIRFGTSIDSLLYHILEAEYFLQYTVEGSSFLKTDGSEDPKQISYYEWKKVGDYICFKRFILTIYIEIFLHYEKEGKWSTAFFYLSKVLTIILKNLMPLILKVQGLCSEKRCQFKSFIIPIHLVALQTCNKTFILIILRINRQIHNIKAREVSLNEADVSLLKKLCTCTLLLKSMVRYLLQFLGDYSNLYNFAFKVSSTQQFVASITKDEQLFADLVRNSKPTLELSNYQIENAISTVLKIHYLTFRTNYKEIFNFLPSNKKCDILLKDSKMHMDSLLNKNEGGRDQFEEKFLISLEPFFLEFYQVTDVSILFKSVFKYGFIPHHKTIIEKDAPSGKTQTKGEENPDPAALSNLDTCQFFSEWFNDVELDASLMYFTESSNFQF